MRVHISRYVKNKCGKWGRRSAYLPRTLSHRARLWKEEGNSRINHRGREGLEGKERWEETRRSYCERLEKRHSLCTCCFPDINRSCVLTPDLAGVSALKSLGNEIFYLYLSIRIVDFLGGMYAYC